MILPSMTWKEMYDGLAQDAKKVQIRIDKTYPIAVKYFKKQDHSLCHKVTMFAVANGMRY